jgi:hypothetical protein
VTEKIYIHLIDGTEAWIPVDAEQLRDNLFSIKPFDEFDPEDTTSIPQFIPGDVVTRKRTERNGDTVWTADQLVERSDNTSKKYFEFLYRTVTGDKLKDDAEKILYNKEIIRTKNEIKEGKFHYPAIADYVNEIGA